MKQADDIPNVTYFGESQRVQYCELGCLFAEDEYASIIEAEVKEPSTPEISDIEATTLTLTWTPAVNSAVTYLIEWRYAEGANTAWNYYGSSEPISESSLNVEDLIPYALYQFRVVWVITPRHTLTSNQSRDVRTEESGAPSTSPTITSLTSSSPSAISVSWEPPPFPNGPITGYSITVQNFMGQPYVVRSVVASKQQDTVVDSSLQASTLYRVFVRASNMAGDGPADGRNLTTAETSNVTGIVPYLVVGVTSADLEVSLAVEASTVAFAEYDSLTGSDTPKNLHTVDRENVTIADVAVHYWKSMLFISDSGGSIHRQIVDPSNLTLAQSQELYTNESPAPTKLDVDWLNDQLYFVEGDEIYRCDLNVSNCVLVITNFQSVPTEMKVDPYLGYLFWSLPDDGIYRIELSSLEGAVSASEAELVVGLSGMSVFAISTQTFQILYANETGDSMHSALLDGSEQRTIHEVKSTDVHTFRNTTSIVYFSNTFTWTHVAHGPPTRCLRFGYEYVEDELFHESPPGAISTSTVFSCASGYHGLDMFYPTYQPIPVPSFPPTGLQALFTNSTADISWTKPSTVPGKGSGAWEEWLYEITITTQEGNTTIVNGITEVYATAVNLEADTEYSIRVRAYSQAGFGPFSEIFTGTTLITVDVDPYLLLTNDTTLWTSELDGSMETAILSLPSPVRDIDWYGDYLVWSTSSGELYRSVQGSDSADQLTIDPPDFSSTVRAIAVDWLSEFIYWADTDQDQIIQGRLSEPPSVSVTVPTIIVPYATDVQDLVIDSVQAYLYWTTAKSVQTSRLNGESRQVIYEEGDLSLDAVAGVTLDLNGGALYWFVVTRENSMVEQKLYRASLAGISPDPQSSVEEIGVVPSATQSVELHFYSSKLFWINDQSQVVVSDDQGKRQALLPASDVQAMSIVQESLKPLPAGFSESPNVIPADIPQSSINIVGVWNDFNVTWQESSEVSYGTVFYSVAITTNSEETYNDIVQDAYYTIENLHPYQALTISITPYTFWASAASTSTQARSPMSVPSIPLNPRAYTFEEQDIFTGQVNYSAEFRWTQPSDANGILQGYKISWGSDEDQLSVITVNTSDVSIISAAGSETNTYSFFNLTGNSTYFFQVEGFTEVGSGPATDPVSIVTGVSTPPPTLALSSSTGVTLRDLDSGTSTSILGGDTPLAALAYIAKDDIFFYVEEDGDEIYRSDTETEILDLGEQQTPSQSNFVLDWISQTLCWSDTQSIYSFDTTLPLSLAAMKTLYSAPEGSSIGGVAVVPFSSLLVWTEVSQSGSALISSDLDGGNISPIFDDINRRRRSAENCSCSSSLSPGYVIVVDSSEPTATRIYFTDSATGDLWVSDDQGCQCQLLFTAASQVNSGLPPDSLSVDTHRIYWSNSAQGIVASVDKWTGADFTSQTGQTDISFVVAYGTSLQPYPDPECLSPADYSQPALFDTSDDSSLTLTLTPVTQCPGVSTAAIIYTVFYGIIESENSELNCSSLNLTCETMESIVRIENLESYSFYVTQVSARNFYSVGSPSLGPSAIFRTSPGDPSPARDVDVQVLTPFEVNVSWLLPVEVNGPLDELEFRVSYSTDNQFFKTQTSDTVSDGDGQYSVLIDGLSGATQYSFTVESLQISRPDNSFTPSNIIAETTFQPPAMVQLVSSTSQTLRVTWTAPNDSSATFHWIRYKEQTAGEWQEAVSGNTTSGAVYSVTIGEGRSDPLTPFTDYEVRTDLLYTSGMEYTYSNSDEILTVQTDASGPDAPGVPTVSETGIGTGTFVVQWSEPVANGPGTLEYKLEARALSIGEWEEVYVGPDRSWIVVGLATGDTYTFRVSAENGVAEGPFSPISEGTALPNPNNNSTTFIIIGAVVAVLVIVAIVVIVLVCCHRKQDSKAGAIFQEDVELAQLRSYPNTLVRQDNSNYAVMHDGKEVLLPIFPRERLKLITFLGSGAFGEVFEGSALDILGSGSGESRVAVKTLRKGATDQEKDEFLKEATIMGKFKHPNIVSLMGVCLDNDPQYIILELMEGGDLLSYIRAARAPSPEKSKITLQDQMDIIYDVVKGCEHLEELHFVHRDLAARNCLVSTKTYDPQVRVVKIGDFGLARDIYKNDYYRKEGEGLLPVRWMSPEGLMDGYFSIQSDVWAFGVLVWEIMSRGQQPYPARSNVEVLRFVEAGGRLEQPENCPDDVYEMMRMCWAKLTEDRPSFKMLREMVYDLRRKSGVPRGEHNFGFQGDGKVNYSHLKEIPPEMEDYLLPMDSKGDIKKPPTLQLPPDIDYDAADKKHEEESKKVKRKGSRLTRSPFSSLRGHLPGASSEATRPRLEAALQDLASNKEKAREIDDERYLKYPVGSVSKATGANLAGDPPSNETTSTHLTPPGMDEGNGASLDIDGAVGYSPDAPPPGDSPDRTDQANYARPRKRHPNPFRANSMEDLDGYDNIHFGAKATSPGGISATDYANV
ncbi:proto-oncogene tyrosine-protein kinase ROS-like [Diadema antillarum]|uniref:proto-oncogene tyrosine-protein kinase ROS-like n=1 Tax=Diadema antillarum TaxID=105358 RepID=UPI003A860306